MYEIVFKINLCCLHIFIYVRKKKQQKPCFYLQKAGNKLLNIFFIGVAIKLAALVSWRTTPVSLC